MDLLWFALACYGLTFLVVYASIFNGIRPNKEWLKGFGKIFHCPLCFGFHAGWFLFVINKWTELFTFDYSWTTAFVLSCVSSGTAYVLSMVFGDEGINFKIWGDYDA